MLLGGEGGKRPSDARLGDSDRYVVGASQGSANAQQPNMGGSYDPGSYNQFIGDY